MNRGSRLLCLFSIQLFSCVSQKYEEELTLERQVSSLENTMIVNNFGPKDYSQIESRIEELFILAENNPRLNSLFMVDKKGLETYENGANSPLGGLCPDYPDQLRNYKKEIWIRFFIAMAIAESEFRRDSTDSNDAHRPHGYWQISLNSKNHPGVSFDALPRACAFSGGQEIKSNVTKNIDCIISFLSLRSSKKLRVYGMPNSSTFNYKYPGSSKSFKFHALHWSILRSNGFLKNKFAPVFAHFTPMCNVSKGLLASPAKQVRPYLSMQKLPGTSNEISSVSRESEIENF